MNTKQQAFLERVRLQPAPYPHLLKSCRIYTGYINHGYGQIVVDGKDWLAHRLAYTLLVGPIPASKHVLHHCDTPPCIEETHLFLGTHLDNVRDMVEKGRQACGETIAVLVRGDRNGSRTHPERVARGDRNGARVHPERVARGDRNGSRVRPERLARGDDHGSHTQPERVARGSRHGLSKLDEDDVREIRQRCACGEKQQALAIEFGIDQTTVSNIVLLKTWSHV